MSTPNVSYVESPLDRAADRNTQPHDPTIWTYVSAAFRAFWRWTKHAWYVGRHYTRSRNWLMPYNRRFLIRNPNKSSPNTRVAGTRIQQLEIWDPQPGELAAFSYVHCLTCSTLNQLNQIILFFYLSTYSPLHALLWPIFTPSNWMSVVTIMILASVQLRYLIKAFITTINDRKILSAELLYEYDTRVCEILSPFVKNKLISYPLNSSSTLLFIPWERMHAWWPTKRRRSIVKTGIAFQFQFRSHSHNQRPLTVSYRNGLVPNLGFPGRCRLLLWFSFFPGRRCQRKGPDGRQVTLHRALAPTECSHFNDFNKGADAHQGGERSCHIHSNCKLIFSYPEVNPNREEFIRDQYQSQVLPPPVVFMDTCNNNGRYTNGASTIIESIHIKAMIGMRYFIVD